VSTARTLHERVNAAGPTPNRHRPYTRPPFRGADLSQRPVTESPPALQLRGVACTFVAKDDPGQRYTAVRDVALTVGAGEFVSVVAPT